MNASRGRPILAPAAFVLAAAAAMVGTPNGPVRAKPSDQISPLELAEWIKAGPPGLQIVDVRAAQEFDRYHIPTARSMPLEALAAARFDPNATLVVYSERGGHAAQAWSVLRESGYQHVLSLRGGIEDWLEDVMHPAAPTDVTRYFGGFTRKPGDAPLTVDGLRRHGC